MIKNIFRALRLPFLTASVFPFIFGSLIKRESFNFFGFLLGLAVVVFTQLSVNLINDYADSKSGADWQDTHFFGFFGGSKLIQEKVFSEKFYFNSAILFAFFAGVSVIRLAFLLKSTLVIIFYLLIIFLSWAYSQKPLQFSYHRLGEFIIFLLFGPALVMGGYYIQAEIFPDFKSFILSLSFGFFVTAILFANEVPDFTEDKKVGKNTWVSLTERKYAFVLYYLLISCAFLAIILDISLGYLDNFALLSFICVPQAVKAANILKKHYDDKAILTESSKLTIAVHSITSIILIFSIIL